jgi:dynein heavy chain
LVVVTGIITHVTVENLNTFLNDNKVLCLPNGEKINRPDSLILVFSTNINFFTKNTPATISRNSIIFV